MNSEYQEHFSPDGEHLQYQMENPELNSKDKILEIVAYGLG